MNIENKYRELKEIVEKMLKNGLPQNLFFHNINHTMKDVLPFAEKLAELENIDNENKYILMIAVLFHDTGYIFRYDDNEVIGMQIAEKYLKEYDFPQDKIEHIKRIISATKVNFIKGYPEQSPSDDILERIMCDADLVNIGRNDFIEQSLRLIDEMEAMGKSIDTKKWWESQHKFLMNHCYFTKSAQEMLKDGKTKNISALYEYIDFN